MRQVVKGIARLHDEAPLRRETRHIRLTKFDARTTLSAHVRAILRESCGAEALHTVIRVNVDLVRAQMARQSIFAYDRTSTGAQDYQHLVEELLGTRSAVETSGTGIPFRHPRKGPGGRKAPKRGRAAPADSV